MKYTTSYHLKKSSYMSEFRNKKKTPKRHKVGYLHSHQTLQTPIPFHSHQTFPLSKFNPSTPQSPSPWLKLPVHLPSPTPHLSPPLPFSFSFLKKKKCGHSRHQQRYQRIRQDRRNGILRERGKKRKGNRIRGKRKKERKRKCK